MEVYVPIHIIDVFYTTSSSKRFCLSLCQHQGIKSWLFKSSKFQCVAKHSEMKSFENRVLRSTRNHTQQPNLRKFG